MTSSDPALGTPNTLPTLRLVATPDPHTLLATHQRLDPTKNQLDDPPRPEVPIRDRDPRELGKPRQLVASVGTLLLEVLQGHRPASHLGGTLTEPALAVLAAWARQPVWTGATLGSVRACLVNGSTVEGCLRLDLGDRSLMLTLRLEHRRGQWVGTDFAPLHARGHLIRAA